MKIAFYLENRNIANVDLSEPELGNPGCGGTEYLFVALPYYLSKHRSDQYQPVIFANDVTYLPKNIPNYLVDDVCDAAKQAMNLGCDFFVYRPRRKPDYKFIRLIEHLSIPTIAWFHITPMTEHLRLLANANSIKATICVEHEQCDMAQDSPVWSKLSYIVNGFDLTGYQLENPPAKESGLVVYIGALVPQKGFHILAKAWPRILKKCPNAQLAVIGSGALYDNNARLGPWGVAEFEYETKYLVPYLSDSIGRPHPSVRFLGKLGIEKKDYLYKAIVGVPNPSGRSENCPGSAIEIQASGTAIVSGAYYGLLDTVCHGKTGLLGNSEDEFVINICSLLKNERKSRELGLNGVKFVKERYDFRGIVDEWCDLFERLKKNQSPKRIPFKRNLYKHYKYLVFINKPLQMFFGRFIKWPSVMDMKLKILKWPLVKTIRENL